jgi:hypothetical protein
MNVLDPSLKHGEWSTEEDQRLMTAVSELGPGRDLILELAELVSKTACMQESGLRYPNL